MEEVRKQEIIKLIENDDTEAITKEEAKEFLDCLTEEEKKHVYEVNSQNRHKRAFKAEEERRRKLWRAHDERAFRMGRLYALFTKDTPLDKDALLEECKEFAVNFLVDKEPIVNEIEGIGKFYECPDCSDRLGRYQPFCANCGCYINWSVEDVLGY